MNTELNNMTYDEFVADIWEMVAKSPKSWRKGQAVFNVIEEKYDVARTVQFVDGVDCFYDDTKIQDFINHAWVHVSSHFPAV